jgi:hypothetical protein
MSKTEVQNSIVGIVGRKGTGKSTYLRELLRRCPRFVVFDVMAEHSGQGHNRFESGAQLGRFLKWSRDKQTFAGAYVPGGDLEEEIEEASRLVYARGQVCFACEEVPLYTHPGYMPPLLGKLIRTGRHRQIDIVWTAQRAAEVPKTLTALTDIWILFSQVEPRDLGALVDRCGREVADRVAALGLHDFFVFDAVAHEAVQPSSRILKREFDKEPSRKPAVDGFQEAYGDM